MPMGAPFAFGAGATLLFVSASARITTGVVTSNTFSLDCGVGGDVAICMTAGANVTFGNATIGGVSASVVVQQKAGGSSVPVGIAAARGCPAGVQNVTVTTATGNTGWTCYVFTMNGVGSMTPTATGSDSAAIGGDSGTLSNVANGCTLGITQCTNGGTPVTWTGLSKDSEVAAGVVVSAPAHQNFITANAALAWSTSFGGAGNQTAAAWASWGPP